jgi:hypothetical protein
MQLQLCNNFVLSNVFFNFYKYHIYDPECRKENIKYVMDKKFIFSEFNI